ncbi:peptidoglycan-binding domain-containing protein [Massilia sp. UMI-21]|nr:peptidoglycan-binding domain-containing protein [Massilia sp. UMI-21]
MTNNRTVEQVNTSRTEVTLEPSGRHWVSRYGGSENLRDLRPPFRDRVEAFVEALRAAGARVAINATYRPGKRAYLMHWSWKIANRVVSAENVPAMDGVPISWKHYDRDEKYADAPSIAAAREMVRAFRMERLGVAPSLNSRHVHASGIDMTISWARALTLPDAYGNVVEISTFPRTGMNPQLHVVGASYGVIKYNRRGRDDPHWSDTGA